MLSVYIESDLTSSIHLISSQNVLGIVSGNDSQIESSKQCHYRVAIHFGIGRPDGFCYFCKKKKLFSSNTAHSDGDVLTASIMNDRDRETELSRSLETEARVQWIREDHRFSGMKSFGISARSKRWISDSHYNLIHITLHHDVGERFQLERQQRGEMSAIAVPRVLAVILHSGHDAVDVKEDELEPCSVEEWSLALMHEGNQPLPRVHHPDVGK